jgi:DNA-binding SARP family transcriptional activator
MMRQRSGSGALAFVRSLSVFAIFSVVIPWGLMAMARARFGGSGPLHGVTFPAGWDTDRVRAALTDRLTDQTVADVVIRLALLVAWTGTIVLVITIVAEASHMLRHDGLAMPHIRGLGPSQSAARIIAAGLLVVVPVLNPSSKADAREGTGLLSALPSGPAAEMVEELSGSARSVGDPTARVEHRTVAPAFTGDRDTGSAGAGEYVVRAGDSIHGIAERLVGSDPGDVAEYADALLELNLGHRMNDGQRFTNAAYIDVGWVLTLPPIASLGEMPASRGGIGHHMVERGESLWSIAEAELGDARRWPEIHEANEGRTFEDGRTLDDPNLIWPGWDLLLPSDGDDVVVPVDAPAVQIDELAPADGTDVGESLDEAVDAGPAVDHVARPENVWVPTGRERPAPGQSDGVGDPSEAPRLLTYGRAAMLSAGILTLLAVRRRDQLRQTRPRARLAPPDPGVAATERALRSTDPVERLERVEAAIRAAAPALVEHGARVLAVLVGPDGAIELRASAPAVLAVPWAGRDGRWELDAATPIELLADAARHVGAPCPTLVQLGQDADGRDVYVDLEALEALEVGGPDDQADAIVAALAATLAGSVMAEVTTFIGVGVPASAFLGHRRYEQMDDPQRAFEVAASAVGSTAAAPTSTFELRSRVASGETWEPAVVLVGSATGSVAPPADRTGMAVVSASPIRGPSSRLAPDGEWWELKPAGIRLLPIGLTAEEVGSIADLVQTTFTVNEPVRVGTGGAVDATRARADHDREPDDLTLGPSSEEQPVAGDPPWSLLVRLLGPVDVVAVGGESVVFERSKTRELVAWLATHRERSTRSAARTALWELDVRDATFANVVSEARRALARLVPPPAGDEWVGRTLTDDLPLHELVRTDADLLRHALDVATLQSPAHAVATLNPAVELIGGLPFESTSYLWPDAEGLTSQLVLLATSAAAELAGHCLALGDIDGVFTATGRGLRVLPGHEELIGLRMQAYARAGDHAGVRHEWESYERVITADPWSDGEPSPKLVELRRELLHPSR